MMAGGNAKVEHLQQFLRELSLEHRTRLVTALERAMLRKQDVPGGDMVLRELRRILGEDGNPPPRIGNAARLFFNLIEPFIVDDAPSQKHPGRIARATLDPIWQWIRREFMVEAAETFTERTSAALLDGDRAAADALTCSFQDDFVVRFDETMAAIKDDEKAGWRFFAKINTPRATDDIDVLVAAFRARDRLTVLSDALPDHIANFADLNLNDAKTAVDAAVKGQPTLYRAAILVMMSKLAAPWQVIRLAIKAAKSDSASRVAETPFAVAVDIVLAELERLIRELRTQLHGGRAVAVTGLLKAVHDTARGLRTELALPVESPWGKQFGAARTKMSELLKSELEAAPGLVRRLLRTRPAAEIARGATLKRDDVSHAEGVIDLVVACRAFASELAINELSMRTYSDIKQYLDATAHSLLEAVRHAGEDDLSYLQSQFDAAASLCTRVFGPDYTAALTQATGAERKAARA